MNIRLLEVKEATGQEIIAPIDVAALMFEEAKADRECLWVLHLNTSNKIIEKELVAMGTLNTALVHPREVFKKAIINSANSIIVVHNHPGGSTKLSCADRDIYRRLTAAGKLLEIPVDDFIVISREGYTSVEEKGL